MHCEHWQEAISARADGEHPAIDQRLLDAHLEVCAECRNFADNVHVLRRAASIDIAPSTTDHSTRVVKVARSADRRSVWWVLRLGLAVVACQIILFSIPALLLGHLQGSDKHAARHLGSFEVAYAIGLLVVGLRPAKARGLLPLTAALAGCLVVTGIIDAAEGHTPALAEIRHFPEVVGLVLVWALAMPRRLPGSPLQRPLPALKSVSQRANEHEQRRSS